MRLTTVLKLTLIVSAAAAIFVVISMGVSPLFARQARLALTAVIVAGHSAVGLGLAAASERGRLPRLMRLGMVFAAVGATAWLGTMWGGVQLSDRSLGHVVALASTGMATLLMIIGVELAQPANGVVALGVRRATVGLTVVLMPLWIYGVLGPIWDQPWLGRVMASIGIVVVCGLLTNLLMARLHGLDHDDGPRGEITIACPRCGVGQSIRLGGDACARCGLRITVHMP